MFERNAMVTKGLLAEEVEDSTAKGYSSAWMRFRKYCVETRRDALPAAADMMVV